jgi:pyruvate dehydrogenase E2 component (dihydrolipoamide acetyltransferase)
MSDDPILGEAVPLRGMRGTIAKRMHHSLRSMAQLTLHREADARGLVRYRDEMKASPQYALLSYNDVILLAVARTLPQHRALNATLQDELISRWVSVNLGIAVSLDDGLIVPVIKDCQDRSLLEIMAEARRLSERARQGVLVPQEVLGATFTVTNLGAFGVDGFTPIVNPPEVAILGVGRIRDATTLTLSLTIDHRAVDGVPGTRFLADLSEAIADPSTLTL